jgi:hypothetical protein
MGAMQRRKGTRGEQEVATAYRQQGIPAARVPNSGGLDTKGDIVGVPATHVEVKCAARISILEWMRQAEAEAPPGHTPAVHFRQSSRTASTGWFVCVPLDDFIGLLKEANGV